MADSENMEDCVSEVALYIDRCRICYFYWEMFIVYDKNRNLANYGWFLEILGKMADSRNRWRNQIQKIVLR